MTSAIEARFRRSHDFYKRARKSLAGGVSSQFRAGGILHPMFYDRASGSRVWDVDGNELIDFTLAQGPCILGHSHPELVERVNAAIARAQLFAGQHEDEVVLAETLQRLIPSAERVRFSSSGSEAAHIVLRLARYVTGRSKYIKFEGHYHGWLDNVSFNVAPPPGPSNQFMSLPLVTWGGGIPKALAEDVIVLPWNNLSAVHEVVGHHGNEIASIIAEPIMCNQSCIEPEPGFLAGLREICDRHGILLIFDEIITGLRIDLGGAQAYYRVTPDLSFFGKALGSGFPISAIVGTEKAMRPLEAAEVYHAGTLNGNNACVAAGLATIDILERNDRALHRHIIELGRRLRDALAGLAHETDLPLRVQGPGPMFHMGFTRANRVAEYRDILTYDRELYHAFARHMLVRGVRLIERGLWYISAAHTDQDVELAIAAARDSLAALAKERRG